MTDINTSNDTNHDINNDINTTPHDHHNIKEVLFSTFCTQYNSLVATVNLLPLDPMLKMLVGFSFGTAFTYAKEHICRLPDSKPVVDPQGIAPGEPNPQDVKHSE